MSTVTLTQAATAAAQFLGVLDPGEGLSAQQLTDALNVANNLLESLWQEQTLALQVIVTEQAKAVTIFLDSLSKQAAPLVQAYTLAAGAYTAALGTPPSYTPGTMPQFADNTTPITLPLGYIRILKLELAVELAAQYDMTPSPAVVAQLAEARAAANPKLGTAPVPGTAGTQAEAAA